MELNLYSNKYLALYLVLFCLLLTIFTSSVSDDALDYCFEIRECVVNFICPQIEEKPCRTLLITTQIAIASKRRILKAISPFLLLYYFSKQEVVTLYEFLVIFIYQSPLERLHFVNCINLN